MFDLFIQYLPEIVMILSILAPLLPTSIMKVLTDRKVTRMLNAFKVEQEGLRTTASTYQFDAQRLSLQLQHVEEQNIDLKVIMKNQEIICRQLGIKPITKEDL